MEQLFDRVVANGPQVTHVEVISDQVFVSRSPEEVIKAGFSFLHNTHVVRIKKSGLRLGDDFAVTQDRKVKMGGSKLDDALAIALSQSLETNTYMEKLDLERNSIGSEGLVALAKSLGRHGSIAEVLLRHQSKPMASSDEEKLPELLQPNESIVKLSMDIRGPRTVSTKRSVSTKHSGERTREKKPNAACHSCWIFSRLPTAAQKYQRNNDRAKRRCKQHSLQLEEFNTEINAPPGKYQHELIVECPSAVSITDCSMSHHDCWAIDGNYAGCVPISTVQTY